MENQISSLLGKEVVVRAEGAGVFFGTLVGKEGNEVQLKDARKLYYWSGAKTVEDLAVKGVKYPDNCQFTIVVDNIIINNYIQILPCTKKASISLKNVSIWTV